MGRAVRVAIGEDGTLYVSGGGFPVLHAVLPGGTIAWTFTSTAQRMSPPAVSRDGTITVGDSDGRFHALAPDGTVKWSFDTGGTECGAAAIDREGTAYFACAGVLHAVNRAGAEIWNLAQNTTFAPPVLGAEGRLYIVSGAGLSAVDSGDSP